MSLSCMRPKSPTGPLTIPLQGLIRIVSIAAGETLYLMLPKCKVTKISACVGGAVSVAEPGIMAYKGPGILGVDDPTGVIAKDGSIIGDTHGTTGVYADLLGGVVEILLRDVTSPGKFDDNEGLTCLEDHAKTNVVNGAIEYMYPNTIAIPIAGTPAAGDIGFVEPKFNNEFNGLTDYLKIVCDADATGAHPTIITVEAEIQEVNMPTKNPTGPPTIIGVAVGRMADLDTAEDLYIHLPKCKVIKIFACSAGAHTVANAVITASKVAQAITGGVITIAHTGAAGDIDSCTPTAHNTFNGKTDYLKLAGDGGPTAGSVALFTVVYELL